MNEIITKERDPTTIGNNKDIHKICQWFGISKIYIIITK